METSNNKENSNGKRVSLSWPTLYISRQTGTRNADLLSEYSMRLFVLRI